MDIGFKGFTLAEVLITLGIIGVVAALTIPTLVANYQEKAWNTSAQVFQRKLEEALKTMNTQQTLAGYSNTLDFVNALSKYFKITNICKDNNINQCFEKNITWSVLDTSTQNTVLEPFDASTIRNASDLGQNDWNTEAVGIQFANGTTGIIAYNPECKEQPFSNQFSGTSCIALIYDSNGFKTPNSYSKDIRSVNARLYACSFKSANTCFTAPFYPEPITKAECEQLKSDLGINSCNYDADYWAGAVKACGGVGKMPTSSKIDEIAKYLYNTSNINSNSNTYGITLDNKKLNELGFKLSGSYFGIWSGEEWSSYGAYRRDFGTTNTTWYSNARYDEYPQVICIVD